MFRSCCSPELLVSPQVLHFWQDKVGSGPNELLQLLRPSAAHVCFSCLLQAAAYGPVLSGALFGKQLLWLGVYIEDLLPKCSGLQDVPRGRRLTPDRCCAGGGWWFWVDAVAASHTKVSFVQVEYLRSLTVVGQPDRRVPY